MMTTRTNSEFQSLHWTLRCKDCGFCFLNDNVKVIVKIKIFEAVNHRLHSVGSGYIYTDILYIYTCMCVLKSMCMFIYVCTSTVCVSGTQLRT